MWTVPRREGPDERCDRLIAMFEQQIADLAASRPTPYWDGGLAAVCSQHPNASCSTVELLAM